MPNEQLVPIIEIAFTGMKQAIRTAFASTQLEMDKMFQSALEAACDPAVLQKKMDETVKQEIDQAVAKAVAEYFRYGEGSKIIAAEVTRRLQRDNAWYRREIQGEKPADEKPEGD